MLPHRDMLKNWIPAALWMVLIFVGSTDLLAARHTSGWITAVLRWFDPHASARTLARAHFLIRKAGHFTEYAVLAHLIWRASRPPTRPMARSLGWRPALLVWIIAVLYAVSDEFHQTFVATRQGSAFDVLIDSIGAGVGLAILWTWLRFWSGRQRGPCIPHKTIPTN